ncbi:nitroreductase family protein [Meiothermus taiwanensis]|jgi:FMN reductase (NADPH)|uniref:FMN reductase (NADPH) n=1 Tax=Meiothermus taiwanensis TaxID=172827 RepID=A0A399DUB5_9DEIN|nr:nitroreductase family protein [Meiothermus taiwanensis]KIQ53901.1 NAD(P)H nitroreductase [Meiothermus taiwanensis]KZK15517.1 NADPH-dependent oxidoreductase [Meiothermus taiwanensis]RIH75647.1 FMN reductase (NADPH) [Meiothermus taiwanensis]
MNDLHTLYQRRASVRKFKPEPLREGDLEKILFAAQRAPTDATAQMYSLLRISDPELRRKVSSHSGHNPHIETCAEFFLILADVYRLRRLVEHRGGVFGHWPRTALHFAITDAVLAGSALATMAESLGYGIVWIGGVLNGIKEIKALCGLPQGVIPVAGLCVGVPDESPAPRPRLPREMVVHENRYHDYSPEALEQAYTAMAPITRSGDWYRVLERYFAQGGTMEQREPAYQQLSAQQGFEPDLPPDLLEALKEKGLEAGSLGQLIEAAFAQGFRSLQFHSQGHVWIEKEPEAYRGEGQPGQALAEALLQAPRERIIP